MNRPRVTQLETQHKYPPVGIRNIADSVCAGRVLWLNCNLSGRRSNDWNLSLRDSALKFEVVGGNDTKRIVRGVNAVSCGPRRVCWHLKFLVSVTFAQTPQTHIPGPCKSHVTVPRLNPATKQVSCLPLSAPLLVLVIHIVCPHRVLERLQTWQYHKRIDF